MAIKQQTIAWKTFSKMKPEPVSWLIRELIPTKSTVCLYGQRGMGKTFLALDFALSIATGKDWNGFKVDCPGRVAYLLAERPEGLHRRIKGWLEHQGIGLAKGKQMIGRSFIAARGEHFLDNEADLKKVTSALTKEGPFSLIIIDPLISFMEGNENTATAMRTFVSALDDIRIKFDCTVMAVHHEGKGEARGARGSSALEAGMDTVLFLKRKGHSSELAEFEVTKQREHAAHDKILLKFTGIKDSEGTDLGMFPELHSVLTKPTASLEQRLEYRYDLTLSILDNLKPPHTQKLIREKRGELAKRHIANSDGTVCDDLKSLCEGKLLKVINNQEYALTTEGKKKAQGFQNNG